MSVPEDCKHDKIKCHRCHRYLEPNLMLLLTEAREEIFRLHNPHSGEECNCSFCAPIRKRDK